MRKLQSRPHAESAFYVAMSSDEFCLEDISGRWKVIDVPSDVTIDLLPDQDDDKATVKELTGLVLVVESQGEVTWEIPPNAASDSLLLFDTNSAHINKNIITFLGGEHGWSLTFKVKGEPSKGLMILESDTTDDCVGFSLSLAKEENIPFDVINDHFTLSKALDELFFSDVEFISSDGVTVLAHRAILEAAYPTMNETNWISLFHMQPSDMCHLLLSCIYNDSLPHNLTVERAQQLVLWLDEEPLMARLSLLLSGFIEANNLRQKMISLIDELLALLEDAKKTISNLTMTDSMKVMYTAKHLCKDVILGGAKICLLCQLYTKNKKEMSKSDKKQVLEYLRARVVMFIDLVKELALEAVEKWEALPQNEQFELATELIPHVEQGWDKFLEYATSLQVSLTQTLESRYSSMLSEAQRGTKVSMILHLLSRGSERKRLQKIRKEFLESVEMAQSKRERWKRYNDEEKAGQIINVVSKLVNEAEDLQVSMETRKKHLLENRLEWKAFRSYVDIVCMYMSWGLQKTLSLKDSLKNLLYEGLKFVGKTEVNEVAVYLGLFDESELETWLESIGWEQGTLNISRTFPMSLPQTAVIGPPLTSTSVLAQGCVQLAATQQYTDMEFVLGNTIIRAHRVIVASRCEWAYCALLSGMKEDREKRIVISDVEENVFRRFLNYLYGGPLGTATMETQTLVDLMEVADRFDASKNLVHSCESLLSKRIEDSSVFELLKISETFNTHALRESCMRYILQRPEVIIEVDGFKSLTEDIQQEIRDLLSGTQDPTLVLRHSRPTIPHTIRSDSSAASSEDDEELHLESNTIEWDIALDSLRAVIGSEVTEDMLRELLLAADMDINRAINFFFNT